MLLKARLTEGISKERAISAVRRYAGYVSHAIEIDSDGTTIVLESLASRQAHEAGEERAADLLVKGLSDAEEERFARMAKVRIPTELVGRGTGASSAIRGGAIRHR